MSKNSKPISVEHSVKYTYAESKMREFKRKEAWKLKHLIHKDEFKPGDICVLHDKDYNNNMANAFLCHPTFLVKGVKKKSKEPALVLIFGDQKCTTLNFPTKRSIHITKKGFDQITKIHPNNLTKIGEL